MAAITTTEHRALRVAAMAAVLCFNGPARSQEPAPVEQAAVESESDAAAEAVTEERRIDVWEYRIDGNTVLQAADIEAAVQGFLGPQRTIADIQEARNALQDAYRKRGYETVGVDIPEQDVRSGIVRFQVTELTVGRLRVTGARYYSPEEIKRRMPSLKEGTVPRYDLVQKDIGDANSARDRTITPALRAGAATGTVDVDMDVQDQLPMHGSLELNDRYSTHTSRLRLVGAVSYSNLFQRDHSLSVQVQVAPEDLNESSLLSVSYLAPLSKKANLVVYGVRNDSDVLAVGGNPVSGSGGGINVVGKGSVYGVRGVWTLSSSDTMIQSLIAGADYKNNKETLRQFDEEDGWTIGNTPISYVPITVEYSLNQFDKKGSTKAGISLNLGTRGLGSDNEEFGQKRSGARANYFYTKGDVSRTQIFPRDFRLTGTLAGQLSDQPLISNEGFSIGGLDSVRGYLEAQEIGDSGLRASLQIDTPSISHHLGKAVNELRFFSFVDWGRVWIKDALADLTTGDRIDQIQLLSTGLGMRLQTLTYLNTEVALAAPLEDRDEKEMDIDDRYRVMFRLWAEF
jgi:hemolysin activation/secretion protein